MPQYQKRIVSIFCFASIIAATSTSFAKKGGGGKPDEGGETTTSFVYYAELQADGARQTFLVMPEGSGHAPLPFGGPAYPSRALHGGHRWFLLPLEVAENYWPDGSPRFEWFAVREDGTTAIQLTNQEELSVRGGADDPWIGDDGLMTFSAIGWDLTTGTPFSGGVYTAGLKFDEDGDLVGLTAQPDPANPVIETPLFQNSLGHWQSDLSGFTWSPDLTAIAWSMDGDLFVTDFPADPFTDNLIASDAIFRPTWSPDGTRIAFNNGTDIDSICPDGSNWFVVESGSSGGAGGPSGNTQLLWPVWSPDSTKLAFTRLTSSLSPKGSSLDYEIVVKNASGKGGVTTVADPVGQSSVTQWR